MQKYLRMGKKSEIQWTEATWNPWQGCTKISDGCKYCYMYREKERFKQDPFEVVRSSEKTFNIPLNLKNPSLIFTCSWSDFFHKDADEYREEAWKIIKQTPQHTYQILTKRPERILHHLPKDWGDGYENVWLGISGEDQENFDERMFHFKRIKAKVKFVSLEPLIGGIYMREEQVVKGHVVNTGFLGNTSREKKLIKSGEPNRGIDWVIVGGESGNEHGKYKFRPCELDWISGIILQCELWSIPVFVKQLGTHLAKQMDLKHKHGGDINEWKQLFAGANVRQMPKTNQ